MSGRSLCLNDNLGDTLYPMYPGFENAKNFSMTRSKSMYGVSKVLAPYFNTLLQTILEKSEILSYSFDESLSEVIHTREMDLFLKFSDDIDKCVKVSYFGSTFLGRGKTH